MSLAGQFSIGMVAGKGALKTPDFGVGALSPAFARITYCRIIYIMENYILYFVFNVLWIFYHNF
jgi:hypothetical protein